MNTRHINEDVKRKLIAESMGRCMNPDCCKELFSDNGDIMEKAHIVPYCNTNDNSFENLVILCPNCHTNFDKNHAFTSEEIINWKKLRQEEINRFFNKKYSTFDELKNEAVPLLLENKNIYENYYLKGNKYLWDKFENKILVNNKKLKQLFTANMSLFQLNKKDKDYSNQSYIQTFIAHVDEFEATRTSEEKCREILFPAEINSMFGIAPVKDKILPSTESLELLIKNLKSLGKFKNIVLGVTNPYIQIAEKEKIETIYLDDTPRIRQLYNDYKCFTATKVRLDSLNFALRHINRKKLHFDFLSDNNLREIVIKDIKLIFIYEYCLSKAGLMELLPEASSVIVNLHGWNGPRCISNEAYETAKIINVTLLTSEDFYLYINELAS